MSDVKGYKPSSAVANMPGLKELAEADKAAGLKVGAQMSTNPDAGGGTSSATSQQSAKSQVKAGDTFEKAKPQTGAAKPKPGSINRPVKAAPGQAGKLTSATRTATARNVQRGGLEIFKKGSGGVGFVSSSARGIRQYAGYRSTYRYGISNLVRSYSLKSVLRSLARKSPRLGLKLFGGGINVIMYVFDTSDLGTGQYPPWRRRYHRAISSYERTDDPKTALNEIRKMNAIIYQRQEIDTKSFIVTMTALGEVFSKTPSKKTEVLRKYRTLLKQFKQTLLLAAENIEKNVLEAERIYKQVQIAYSWNTSYMSYVNNTHLPYIKSFKKVAERYRRVSQKLRNDPTTASADLS